MIKRNLLEHWAGDLIKINPQINPLKGFNPRLQRAGGFVNTAEYAKYSSLLLGQTSIKAKLHVAKLFSIKYMQIFLKCIQRGKIAYSLLQTESGLESYT